METDYYVKLITSGPALPDANLPWATLQETLVKSVLVRDCVCNCVCFFIEEFTASLFYKELPTTYSSEVLVH